LHRHFPDFDAFLGTLVLRHLTRLDALSAELRASAGAATVEDNLAAAITNALDPATTRIISLVCCRRSLLELVRVTTPTGIPLLAEATKMVAGYLTAERGLGRIALTVDVDRLAPMLVGGAYLLAAPDSPASVGQVRDLLTSTLQSVSAQAPPPRSAHT
jgi:AcrR family transcriptional regulator